MEFVKFKRAVHAQFNQLAAGADMLFLTNVDKDALWDCYLNSFPEEDRLLESEKKAKRQKILDLMAKKQDAELEGKSLEELAKELEALN